MAKMTVYREWHNGEKLQLMVEVQTSYPDALAEAKRTVLDAYAEALEVTLAGDTEDVDDD